MLEEKCWRPPEGPQYFYLSNRKVFRFQRWNVCSSTSIWEGDSCFNIGSNFFREVNITRDLGIAISGNFEWSNHSRTELANGQMFLITWGRMCCTAWRTALSIICVLLGLSALLYGSQPWFADISNHRLLVILKHLRWCCERNVYNILICLSNNATICYQLIERDLGFCFSFYWVVIRASNLGFFLSRHILKRYVLTLTNIFLWALRRSSWQLNLLSAYKSRPPANYKLFKFFFVTIRDSKLVYEDSCSWSMKYRWAFCRSKFAIFKI